MKYLENEESLIIIHFRKVSEKKVNFSGNKNNFDRIEMCS